jgi:hypothetical protein
MWQTNNAWEQTNSWHLTTTMHKMTEPKHTGWYYSFQKNIRFWEFLRPCVCQYKTVRKIIWQEIITNCQGRMKWHQWMVQWGEPGVMQAMTMLTEYRTIHEWCVTRLLALTHIVSVAGDEQSKQNVYCYKSFKAAYSIHAWREVTSALGSHIQQEHNNNSVANSVITIFCGYWQSGIACS